MKDWSRIARTHVASGRFVFPLLAFMAFVAGCTPVATTTAGAAPPSRPDPVLEAGSPDASEQAQAADLVARAARALDAGQAEQARELAAQVVQQYPATRVSGRALFLMARAEVSLGRFADADARAGRYAGLLSEGDPRRAEAYTLQAEAQQGAGNPQATLQRLLQIGPGAETNLILQASEMARSAVAELDGKALGAILQRTPEDRALRPIVGARYALFLDRQGDHDQARAVAQAALAGGAQGVDSLTADAIVRGVPVSGGEAPLRQITIGTVLPMGGSPGFREFAGLIAEGVEVAASSYLAGYADVHVDARDDMGDAGRAAEEVRALEETDALGVVGFLESGALEASADLRNGDLPLISPTARVAPEGTYSLDGADPAAAAAMARYAARAGFKRVAVIHSRAPESTEEADAFVTALQEEGVPLAGRFAYDAGATFFEEQIKGARDALRAAEIAALNLGEDDTLHVEMLEPVAVFLPIPPEDVELVAPQVTFFGLDTLAIQTLGTSGWTDPETLSRVDQRHTTGVIATAPVDAGPGSTGYARFREAYEDHFQRSLVSPVPALGYDAALLLLEASRTGARTPVELRATLEHIRDLEGATGTFSVVNGRVVRRTHIVQIEHGTLIPAR